MTTALVKTSDLTVHKLSSRSPTRKVTRRKSRKKRSSQSPSSNKWYQSKIHSGWRKDMAVSKRRKLLLKAHGGSLLASARSKQALANVTQDLETRRAAQSDATYFFREYKRLKEGK